MKIAIFHPFLDNVGGAEILTLILARELKADVFTTNIDPEKIKKMGFQKIIPKIKSIGRVPINAPFRHQLTFFKFRFLNLKNRYDLYIVSGDWAMSAVVNHKPNLWYTHSPLNELFEFKDFVKYEVIKKKWMRPLFDLWVSFNRYFVRKYACYVERWVCNSKNTQRRIKKYLKREARVIHPPIETKNFYYNKNGDFWLSVNRLSRAKRIDLQLKAFQRLKDEKLIIVGSYEKGSGHFETEKRYLENIKPKNVEIKSWVSQDELRELYANCKGFITTSKNEDFGMTAIEAMASGKPVIAPNEGGYQETVINGKTGILIDDIDEEKLKRAIEILSQKIKENPLIFKENCQEQAKKFDTKIFIKKIKNEIQKII